MLPKTLCALLVLCTAASANIATQTHWSGGGGIPGPVADWGSSFDTSSDVNATIGGVLGLASVFLSSPSPHTVGWLLDYATSVYATDADGDGDTDVLGAQSSQGSDILWWDITGYSNEGALESSILDAGFVDSWELFSSSSTEPTGTSVGFQFRSSSDAGDMGA